MDRGSTFSVRTGLGPRPSEDSKLHIAELFLHFILDFRIDNAFIYRDQLKENALLQRWCCDVDIADLIKYNEDLAHRLVTEPGEMIPVFETALRRATHRILYPHDPKARIPDHQLLLHSDAERTPIRGLESTVISRLERVPGIVINASVVFSRATRLKVQCSGCGHKTDVAVGSGFSGVMLPRVCGRERGENDVDVKCPMDPYFVVHEESAYVDQQIIKLQEMSDHVPVGDLPRHIKVTADRYLTNRLVPGSRCTITAIFTVSQQANKASTTSGAVAVRSSYLRAVGIETDVDSMSKGLSLFSEDEEQEFIELSRRPDLYNIMTDSIAPSIYGSRDIKKAILCLLLGGSKKILPDAMKLRGDINVLLLGDPGVAKSQLLRFASKASPISIYTSGKGSSAAGLTASVQRDAATREFYLEGGAMVLADGGVVCIDEFDKMRDEDRVAIHEAMEQQTISIAKAGITTILNARTSVLAAANPVFGRYDDFKSPGENIDFQTTILSRFDMIFVVRDEHSREKDERIAKHVMGIHMGGRGLEDAAEGEVGVEKMKRYLSYCKSRCAPRLSRAASEKLSSHFITIRRQVRASELEASQRSSIPITVRQLEAIIRITESLAKLSLSPIATEAHVDEAIRLFLASTMDAVSQGSGGRGGGSGGGLATNRELAEEAKRVEVELKKRLHIGWSTSLATLKSAMVEDRGFSEQALNRALMALQRRDTVQFRHQGTQVYRSSA